MAEDALSALFDGAQVLPPKILSCGSCGVLCPRTGSRQRFCVECRKEGNRKLARAREHASGATPVGSETQCQDCGTTFVKTGTRHFRCHVCAAKSANAASVERARERSLREKPFKAVKVGYCERCGSVFPIRARKRFCSTCAKIAEVEYNAKWSEENKDKVRENQKRYYVVSADKAKAKKDRYRENNPEKEREYRQSEAGKDVQRRYAERKRTTDPSFVISGRVGHSMWLAIKEKRMPEEGGNRLLITPYPI